MVANGVVTEANYAYTSGSTGVKGTCKTAAKLSPKSATNSISYYLAGNETQMKNIIAQDGKLNQTISS